MLYINLILQYRTVAIQDFELAREMANNDKLSGRSVTTFFKDIRGYGTNIGVMTTEGEVWKVHRKFALATLNSEKKRF